MNDLSNCMHDDAFDYTMADYSRNKKKVITIKIYVNQKKNI